MVHLLELLGVGLAFKSVLIIGFVLAFLSRAFAGTPCTDNLPPARFNHPVTAPFSLTYLDEAGMAKKCGINPYDKPDIYACADTDNRLVYIGKNLPKDWQACLLTHERAHLNGWPANHPR